MGRDEFLSKVSSIHLPDLSPWKALVNKWPSHSDETEDQKIQFWPSTHSHLFYLWFMLKIPLVKVESLYQHLHWSSKILNTLSTVNFDHIWTRKTYIHNRYSLILLYWWPLLYRLDQITERNHIIFCTDGIWHII